jgi:hypothetical protein
VCGRGGVGEIGKLIGLERFGGNGKRAVDRITTGVHPDRVAVAGIAQRGDHRAAFGGGRGAPHDLRRRHHACDRRCAVDRRCVRLSKQLHIHATTLRFTLSAPCVRAAIHAPTPHSAGFGHPAL